MRIERMDVFSRLMVGLALLGTLAAGLTLPEPTEKGSLKPTELSFRGN